MSKSSPTTSGTTTTNVTLPQWYQDAWQSILGQGTNIFGSLAMPVAGMTPDQQMASWLTNSALQTFMTKPQVPAYDVFGMGGQWDTAGGPMKATAVNPSAFSNLTAQQAMASQAKPATATAAQMQPGGIAQWMNPYIDTALNPVLNRLRQQQAEVQAGVGANAAASHMFGGSREAVQRSLADRNYRDTLANTAGNMLNTGFNAAAGLESANVDRSQQAGLLNAQLENAINSLNAQLGTNVSLANASEANKLTGLGAQLGTSAALADAQAQNQLNQLYQNLSFQGAQADAARFLQAVGLQPQIDLSNLQGVLAGTGALNNLGTQQQQTAQNALNQYWAQLNMLAQLLKIGNPGSTSTGTTTSTTTKPFDLGSLLMGGIGLLGSGGLGLLGSSDRDDKTDIKMLGKDETTGRNMYAYRYKGDPKSYPKVVGPMADEMPHREVAGHKVIDMAREMPIPAYLQYLDRMLNQRRAVQ